MKSMTGFGRKDYRDEALEISIEIKTINHRFRDFSEAAAVAKSY